MNESSDLVASFSQDARQFAFQANITQKNSIDIYPLDASNNYKVNSSLVSHIDYENNDLKSSEVIFMGWNSDIQKNNTKRKHDEDATTATKSENFFVNTFPQGKIVVYSSNGKDIVNIIQNKYNITHTDTEGHHIWTLDSDKNVKKLSYNQTKPIKTFHLVDGKDEEIIHFQVLNTDDKVLLAVATEDVVYIIDPTKRRPVTLAKFDLFGCISCGLLKSGSKIAIVNIDKVSIFDFSTTKSLKSWNTSSEKIKIVDDMVFSLSTDGKLVAFDLDKNAAICTIVVTNSEVLDFALIDSSIMIAWLNVNEPNFEMVSMKNIKNQKVITINHQDDDEKIVLEKQESDKHFESIRSHEKQNKKKVSKAKQDELSQSLLEKLEDNASREEILENILSEGWIQERIKKFISSSLTSNDATALLFDIIATKLHKNPWDENESILIWLEWLLTWKNVQLNSTKAKQVSKQIKQLKASLRSSSETLPILLGMQGRLAMLKGQDTLRRELAQLNVADEFNNDQETIEEGENNNAVNEAEDSLTYVNGESDAFFDASEFNE